MRSINIVVLIFLSFLIPSLFAIHVTLLKDKIYVAAGSYYKFHVAINQTNSNLIPFNFSIDYALGNSLPSVSNSFDFFYYLEQSDVECYIYSLYNNSFLFPCPFLANNQTILRESSVTDNLPFEGIFAGVNNANLTYIVDNTRYPYPDGAYPSGPLEIFSQITIQIHLDGSYQALGVRLIFINITVFLLFACFIGKLIYDQRKIRKLMIEKEGLMIRISRNSNKSISKGQSVDLSEGSEGYEQGYDILMNPDIMRSTSKNQSSMLSSESSVVKKQE